MILMFGQPGKPFFSKNIYSYAFLFIQEIKFLVAFYKFSKIRIVQLANERKKTRSERDVFLPYY